MLLIAVHVFEFTQFCERNGEEEDPCVRARVEAVGISEETRLCVSLLWEIHQPTRLSIGLCVCVCVYVCVCVRVYVCMCVC